MSRKCKRFTSPLQKIKDTVKNVFRERIETIQPFTIPPWEPRIPIKDLDKDLLTETNHTRFQIIITTSSSVRKNRVGIGMAIQGLLPPGNPSVIFSQITEWRYKQNPYFAKLAAIARGV